jgi:hypothetical protein
MTASERLSPDHRQVSPGRCAGAYLMLLSRSRWVLRVGSARAGSMARLTRRPLGVGSLNDVVDRPLGRVHVVQPVVGADRLGVCGCPGANPRTRKRNARRARRASHLASESGAGTSTYKDDCEKRSREYRLGTHHRSLPMVVALASSGGLCTFHASCAIVIATRGCLKVVRGAGVAYGLMTRPWKYCCQAAGQRLSVRTTLECRPSTRTATDGPGRCAYSYGSDAPDTNDGRGSESTIRKIHGMILSMSDGGDRSRAGRLRKSLDCDGSLRSREPFCPDTWDCLAPVAQVTAAVGRAALLSHQLRPDDRK